MANVKSLDKLLKVPLNQWKKEDFIAFDTARQNAPAKTVNLPENVVVLPKDEAMIAPGASTQPVSYYVQAGDTLKDIAEMFNISYGELCNHLMNTNGNTSIHAGQKIEIPRHFIDLSKAT